MQAALITPTQSHALVRGILCDDAWFDHFGLLAQAAASGNGIVKFGKRAARIALDMQGEPNGGLWLEQDTRLIYEWRVLTGPPASMGWYYVAGVMAGTFAARLTGLKAADTGLLYQTTDTFQLYQWSGTAWKLFTQVYQRTQAQLVAFAATLGTTDAGLLVNVTDYAHVLQWTGSAWQWGPGEQGSGMLMPFAVAPTGNGWHACDGTVGVSYLKSDGTTGVLTVPNPVAAAAYMQFAAAYAPAIVAATMPVFTGTPGTTASGNAVISNDTDGGSNAAVAAGANVALRPHTHTDSGHTHGFTPAGTNAQPAATDPIANFAALLYFRQ